MSAPAGPPRRRGIAAFVKRQLLLHLPEPILLRLKAARYARTLRSLTYEEEPDLKVVEHLVAPGTTAVDIGANIGVYTKVLSERVGAGGRVISIEPMPQTFAILSHNLRSLRLENVRAIHAAVSDADGTVEMEVPQYASGGENYYEAHIVDGESPSEGDNRRVRARAAKLDTLLDGGGPVGFIKCDAEGHDLPSILGGMGTISRDHPALLIEIDSDPDAPGTRAATLFDTLRGEGYSPWFFDGAKLRPRRAGDRSTNCFFLTEAHVARLTGAASTLFDA